MKAMKKSFKKGLAMTALAAAMIPAANAVEVSGNVSIATDYKFRGISQSDGEAISGGFDVGFDSGFYVGTWGSSIEDWGNGIELDYYAGFATDLSENVSIDVGYLYYGYPNADDDLDFEEIYGSVSFADLTLGFAYSNDYFAETDKYTYLYVDYSIALGEDFSLGLHYGDNSIDDEDGFGTPDYADWNVSLSTEAVGLEFSLSYVDTDLSDDECFGGDDLCEGSVVFSISKSM